MALIVQKFGGTSVGDTDRIRAVADHIALTRRRGDDVIVVVSAMGKATDDFLRMAEEVSAVRPAREIDMLLTAGERISMSLLCMALAGVNVDAVSFTGSQAGIITDTRHGKAKIIEVKGTRLREAIAKGQVPVVAGFQGVSTDNDVTTLGRGGSDTTAVALAAALEASACEIYTDVTGVFSADPRLVPKARRISHISFDEMQEMAATGGRVLALRSVEFAKKYNVPLHVRSSFTWEPGTWVVEGSAEGGIRASEPRLAALAALEWQRAAEGRSADAAKREDPMEEAIVTAVTHDTSEAKVTIGSVPDTPGVAARIFRELATKGVNVDMIVQNVSSSGHTDISFTCPKDELDRALQVLDPVGKEIGAASVTADPNIARVSVIGAGMKSHPGVAATMFETLAKESVNIEMISTSSIRLSCVIRGEDVEKAVQSIHTAYDLDVK